MELVHIQTKSIVTWSEVPESEKNEVALNQTESMVIAKLNFILLPERGV